MYTKQEMKCNGYLNLCAKEESYKRFQYRDQKRNLMTQNKNTNLTKFAKIIKFVYTHTSHQELVYTFLNE